MILHLDMDAFFASVEQLDHPEYRGKPVIVGGGERGVVAAASYEARAFGVRSALPIAIARKLCPQAVFLRGNFSRYRELSSVAMNRLREFTPLVQPASIDEAYADISHLEKTGEEPEEIAKNVQNAVRLATGGLTCSVGVAPIKFLAKICSDYNKPNGVFVLRPEKMDAFLRSLDVDIIPGVGKRMSASLRAFGVSTVAGLRELSREFLATRYGKFGAVLYERARGVDPRPVRENPPQKSEGSERTFPRDVYDLEELKRELRGRAERVGASLKKRGERGRVITLKIKYANFRQITRARSLRDRTDSADIIYDAARRLLEQTPLPLAVRLIGVCVSGFEKRSEQYYLPGIAVFPPA